MPRSKRRAPTDMNSADDDRYTSKRIRNSTKLESIISTLDGIKDGTISSISLVEFHGSKQTRKPASLQDIEHPDWVPCQNMGYEVGIYLKNEEALARSSRRYTRLDEVSTFSQKKCLTWFREYTSPDEPDVLGPEGMEKFCEDIGVEPENVVMLVLAYRMQARQMGFFTQEEWVRGLTELQCDSIQKLQGRLEQLRCMLNDQHTFKAIYRYAYDFARDKDQRSMDMETAKAMLQLLLGKHWPLYAQFSQFLEQSKYKVINKDQWCNILEFSRTINIDLSNYDVDGAWPVMLDEFVEWLKAAREKSDIS